MATKTLTITEEAYNLLKVRKQAGESFSEEIKRLLAPEKPKKDLKEFFGILSPGVGAAMLNDLEKVKKFELEKLRKEFS